MAKQMQVCCTSNPMRSLMTQISNLSFRSGIAALLLTSGLALAQDQSPVPPQTPAPVNGGWRRAGDPSPATQSQAGSAEPVDQSQANQAPVDQNGNPYGQPG